MGIFDKFKKKKKEVPIPEEFVPRELPEDLERFRTERPFVPSAYEPRYPEVRPPEPERTIPREPADKLDMILQKLETIDARLKLIEERLSR